MENSMSAGNFPNKMQQQQPAALPPELAWDIIIRLPPAIVARCACVCRDWLKITSNPKFINEYRSHVSRLTIPHFTAMSLRYLLLEPSISLSFPKNNNIAIDNSCNGLILCHSVSEPKIRWYVCNPRTGDYDVLPEPNFKSILRIYYHLVYDPRESPFYKVVAVEPVDELTGETQVSVYSSETKSWCNIPCLLPVHNVNFAEGTFCDGFVYWLSSTSDSNDEFMLALDVDDEFFCWTMLPGSAANVHYFGANHGGRPSLIMEDEKILNVYENVDESNDFESEWKFRYRIDPMAVLGSVYTGDNPATRSKVYSAIYRRIGKGREVEDVIMLVTSLNEIVLYHVSDGSSEIVDCKNSSWKKFLQDSFDLRIV